VAEKNIFFAHGDNRRKSDRGGKGSKPCLLSSVYSFFWLTELSSYNFLS